MSKTELEAIEIDGKWFVLYIGTKDLDIKIEADSEEHAEEIILNYHMYEQLR